MQSCKTDRNRDNTNMNKNESHICTNEELFMAGEIDALYKRNRSFMYCMMKKFSNIGMEEDEFMGCCDMAFIKAVNNYVPSKSKWTTFFSRIIINEILQEKRLADKRIKAVSFDDFKYKSYKNGNAMKIEDSIVSSADTMKEVINQICFEEMSELIRRLPERKRKILELHFKGKSQQEIGMIMNLSRPYIGKILRQTMAELRKSYEG